MGREVLETNEFVGGKKSLSKDNATERDRERESLCVCVCVFVRERVCVRKCEAESLESDGQKLSNIKSVNYCRNLS